MAKKIYRITALLLALVFGFSGLMLIPEKTNAAEETVVLRVSNWEEYIDLGDWGEDEIIDLESIEILGKNSMVDDFEKWYYEEYGIKVIVEYSTFGTNEDLYSSLTLGDVYDLVCPSDYMIMKLMKENALWPLSEEFYDTSVENNYYAKGVSPYIADVFATNKIGDESWDKYAAGYMWGVTGMIYNPEEVQYEEAATWSILTNSKFHRRVTVKDNVRDAYFPTLGILFTETLMSDSFINDPNYRENLQDLMNRADKETVNKAEAILKDIRQNVYSFETDSGKADMVTGKIVANLQWSGDAVYAMDQAEEDGTLLEWAVPEECTNLWFDGWIMLKDGIKEDSRKQHAAEAFINFLSRPDNVVRNMYYIGYTSAIAGGEDSLVYEYLEWCYGAEDDAEEVAEYPVGYFFSGDNEDENYILVTDAEQVRRQLSAQYPTLEQISRSAVMMDFDEESTKDINQMWINIRCFNLTQISLQTWIVVCVVIVVIGILVTVYLLRHKIFVKKMKKGYRRVD